MLQYKLRTLIILTAILAVLVQFGPRAFTYVLPSSVAEPQIDLGDFVCVGGIGSPAYFQARAQTDVNKLLGDAKVVYFRGGSHLGYDDLWVLPENADKIVKLLETFDEGLFIKCSKPYTGWDEQ